MVTFTVSEQWNDTRTTEVTGSLQFSGNYVANGDTLNLGLPSADSFPKLLKIASPPLFVEIVGNGLYTYLFVLGATINNGKVKIVTNNAELGAGAYPGGVTGDLVTFRMVFKKYR